MKLKNSLKKISLLALLGITTAAVVNTTVQRMQNEEIGDHTTTQSPNGLNQGLQRILEDLRRQLAETRTQNQKLEREILATKSPTLLDRSEDEPSGLNQELIGLPDDVAADHPEDYEWIDPEKEFELAEAIDALETNFWHTEEDSGWSADVESELVGTLEQRAITDTQLDAVQCHSSLCLVEFVHATPEAHAMLLQHLGTMKPFFGGFMVKTDESGPDTRTLVYFPRPGETLPLPLNLLTSEGESL